MIDNGNVIGNTIMLNKPDNKYNFRPILDELKSDNTRNVPITVAPNDIIIFESSFVIIYAMVTCPTP